MGQGTEYIPYNYKKNGLNEMPSNNKMVYINNKGRDWIAEYKENNKDGNSVYLPLFYYKGYSIIESSNEKNKIVDSDNGYIKINIYDKEGMVKVRYTGTKLMKIGYIITDSTIILVGIYVTKRLQKYKKMTK